MQWGSKRNSCFGTPRNRCAPGDSLYGNGKATLVVGGPELWLQPASLWSRQPRRTDTALPGIWRRPSRVSHMVLPSGPTPKEWLGSPRFPQVAAFGAGVAEQGHPRVAQHKLTRGVLASFAVTGGPTPLPVCKAIPICVIPFNRKGPRSSGLLVLQ